MMVMRVPQTDRHLPTAYLKRLAAATSQGLPEPETYGF
jgi:hypothetical protein